MEKVTSFLRPMFLRADKVRISPRILVFLLPSLKSLPPIVTSTIIPAAVALVALADSEAVDDLEARRALRTKTSDDWRRFAKLIITYFTITCLLHLVLKVSLVEGLGETLWLISLIR
jgi:hypothetical protein